MVLKTEDNRPDPNISEETGVCVVGFRAEGKVFNPGDTVSGLTTKSMNQLGGMGRIVPKGSAAAETVIASLKAAKEKSAQKRVLEPDAVTPPKGVKTETAASTEELPGG